MSEATFSGTAFVNGEAAGEIISSDMELSFWGGVDASSGEVIDRHHPLSNQLLTGEILAIPGGRGSCSGRGVILELLLNGKGPAARWSNGLTIS
jgi:predicted aconitase with swiveling domain